MLRSDGATNGNKSIFFSSGYVDTPVDLKTGKLIDTPPHL